MSWHPPLNPEHPPLDTPLGPCESFFPRCKGYGEKKKPLDYICFHTDIDVSINRVLSHVTNNIHHQCIHFDCLPTHRVFQQIPYPEDHSMITCHLSFECATPISDDAIAKSLLWVRSYINTNVAFVAKTDWLTLKRQKKDLVEYSCSSVIQNVPADQGMQVHMTLVVRPTNTLPNDAQIGAYLFIRCETSFWLRGDQDLSEFLFGKNQ